MSAGLLDPAFLRRLAQLRLLARRRFAGGAAGARRSTRRGSSAEFADHRPYYPGDDVRRIDWNAYARLEELVLRLFVAEEDVSLHLLVDTSASLGVGDPPKLDVAKRAAAALAYVGLTGSDRVSVWPWADGLGAPSAPVRGAKMVARVMRTLDALEASGETSLRRSVDHLLTRRPKKGLVAVVSDFLDPEGYARSLDRLLAERYEPVLFHVLAPEELAPVGGGDLVLVDAERGTRVEVSLDERTLAAYRRRLAAFLEEIAGYAKKRGVFYARLSRSEDLEDVLLSYLRAA
ncbi:MAG: DUF58 domain-containing protein [Sandaracinaceae bacterium]